MGLKSFAVLFALVLGFLPLAKANNGVADVWPTIPFVRGADLCPYVDAYGQTRQQFMTNMVQSASQLMQSGAYGNEALGLLVGFNRMYERNLEYATRYHYLDVTLEATLKAYVDQYYRDLRPRSRRLSFTNVNDLLSIVRAVSQGQREGYLDSVLLEKLDYIAYGTYALGPRCQGDIQVTLQLIGKNGETRSYMGQGRVEVVMSQIASRMFEDFQRTQFPSKLKIGSASLELIGGLNGSVDVARSPNIAQAACETLGGRLPHRNEYELIDSYGDWNGGVSLNEQSWAMENNKVFAADLRNPSPVREVWEVNDQEFKYFCVK